MRTLFFLFTMHLLRHGTLTELYPHLESTHQALHRPFDMALIHAPMRAFLILPLGVMFPYSLLCVHLSLEVRSYIEAQLSIQLGWTWSPGEPQHYDRHQWAGFAVMLGVNLLGLAVIVLRRDIVWCVAASWICASVWTLKPKPFPVIVSRSAIVSVSLLIIVLSDRCSHFHDCSSARFDFIDAVDEIARGRR